MAKRYKLIIIIYHIFDNYLTKLRYKLGKFETKTGATHTKFKDILESVKYIDKVFNEYFLYSGLPIEYIKNKRILEIGPGDNFGVALKFLVHGAAKVVCLDKFYAKRDLRKQSQIYKAMRSNLSQEERRIFDSIVKINNNKFEFVSNSLEYIYGKGIEEALDIFAPTYKDYNVASSRGSKGFRGKGVSPLPLNFDMIISRAVMEHVYNIDAAFYNMDKLLKSDGYMIHNIDFRDHGIFTSAGMHPLTFLTIPDKIWKLMTKDSGKPNRLLIDYYKKKMNNLNYEFKIVGVQYLEPNVITEIRPRLQPQFRNLNPQDLMVASIFLIATKRVGSRTRFNTMGKMRG